MYTLPTWEKSTLAVVRETAQERFIGLYNFSENEQMAWINETDGLYTELLTDTKDFKAAGIKMAPYSVLWLWRKK